jgi:hypothetical protein
VSSDKSRADEERKRRQRAKIFGDVLPETTTDEARDQDETESSTDEWLKRQVPPHHG